MSEIYAIALASMHQDMGQVDRIAQNIANVSTTAYKREVGASQAFVEALEGAAVQAQRPSAGAVAGAAQAAAPVQVRLDSRPGTLRITGQAFDVALEGEGFFEVATDKGPAYTRQGAFQVDARGRLVTLQGHAVMGANGEIVLTTRTPVIDSSGRITEPEATSGPGALDPGTPVTQLKVVRPEDGASIQQLGEGLVSTTGGMKAAADGEFQIRQGALENSNVNSMQEMVQLMQTLRHFESMQRVIQGYDDLLATSIRKLGDLS